MLFCEQYMKSEGADAVWSGVRLIQGLETFSLTSTRQNILMTPTLDLEAIEQWECNTLQSIDKS